MARLSFRCGDELVGAVDAARGDVPRETWLRRVVERALGDRMQSEESERAGSTPARPAPAEQPKSGPVSEAERRREEARLRSEAIRRATQRGGRR